MTKYLQSTNKSPVRIRPVRFSDVTAWLDCLRRNHPGKDFSPDLFWERDVWGAFDNGRLVGCVSLWDNELQWLALDGKYNKTILDELVRRAMGAAEDKGVERIVVKTNPMTPDLATLLLDFDFQEISEYEFLKVSGYRNVSEAAGSGVSK
jgi:hypothetical protein